MAYRPESPVGSTSAKDLMANAENFDLLALGENSSYPDRKGATRKSWKGMEREFISGQTSRDVQFAVFLESSGYEAPVPYVSGLYLERPTQTVTYLGNEYRVKSQFLPLTTTTWAADEKKLKLIGDDSLRQQMADGSQNPEILGYKRRLLKGAIRYAQQMMDIQPVSAWEFADRITDKPSLVDPSTWDWQPAIQAALDYAADLPDGWPISLPTLYIKCNSGLTIQFPRTAIIGCMAVLDFSAMKSGTAMTFLRSEPNRPNLTYGGSSAEMRKFSVVGPGRDKQVDAFRIGSAQPMAATTGQAPTFRGVYVQDFRNAIYAGSDAYLARFEDCQFYSNACVLYLPAGEANYGENFSFSGGAIHGNRRVITMEANNASVFFSQVSFDFNGKDGFTQFHIRNSSVNLDSCHLEMGHINTPVTVPPIDISGDQARLSISGGFILAHPNTPGETRFIADYFALIGAGASVTIDGPRVPAIQPLKSFAAGSGRLIVRDWEIGNVSDITGWGKDQVLMDYSFESASIQDMIYIQNGVGNALDWRNGENLILSNSPVSAASGSQSLRVQKRIGNDSSPGGATAFTIAVQARPGERYHYRFKCLDKGGRGGAVGVTMRWGKSLGFDKNGIPRTSQGAPFSIYNFTPTTSWGSYFPLRNINGNDDAACPQNADTLFIVINTNAFVGGTGAPEGGWHSLYFDEFEIYRW